MGYDGGFTKIRMKMRNQRDLDKYDRLRNSIYNIIGKDNFYKFESIAVNLPHLDNDWKQFEILKNTLNKKIRNYETDDNSFTLITKDELGQYISDLYGLLDEKELELYNEDIILLKNLYNTFDWDNDTLIFSYFLNISFDLL